MPISPRSKRPSPPCTRSLRAAPGDEGVHRPDPSAQAVHPTGTGARHPVGLHRQGPGASRRRHGDGARAPERHLPLRAHPGGRSEGRRAGSRASTHGPTPGSLKDGRSGSSGGFTRELLGGGDRITFAPRRIRPRPPRSPSPWTTRAICTSIPSRRCDPGDAFECCSHSPGRRSTELAALHRLAAEGDLGGEARSPSRRAVDVKGPSERLDPVGETPQARSAGRVGAAETVVLDLDPHPSVAARHGYRDAGMRRRAWRCSRAPPSRGSTRPPRRPPVARRPGPRPRPVPAPVLRATRARRASPASARTRGWSPCASRRSSSSARAS